MRVASFTRPVLVGIEAIGPMQWFLNLLEELGRECQVGDATKIRAAVIRSGSPMARRGPVTCSVHDEISRTRTRQHTPDW